MIQEPPVSKALVDYLTAKWKWRDAGNAKTEQQLGVIKGRMEIIEHLEYLHKAQEKKGMEEDVLRRRG